MPKIGLQLSKNLPFSKRSLLVGKVFMNTLLDSDIRCYKSFQEIDLFEKIKLPSESTDLRFL